MLVALALLLVALIVVIGKDWGFWFHSDSATEETADQAAPTSETDSSQPDTSPTATPAAPHTAKPKPRAPAAAPAMTVEASAAPAITATNRAALPPLEVEVVAGGQHTVLQPNNRSVKVDLQSGSPGMPAPGIASEPITPSSAAAPQSTPVATNAGERVRLSPDTAQVVERPVEPSYPMLAKQMKVQGSVVLQALIGREGSIQDLRVLSGPAILSTAAMDAVKQWRFRPYYQSGQPVETEARITVNFTISTY
jgi:protein TonB